MSAAKITPTPEQMRALELFKTGKSLAIEAGAGTGKTSTLVLLAESTSRRGQYIAFNKAIVTESKAKMPRTCRCTTAHGLAYAAIGKDYDARLRGGRMRSWDIAKRLGITQGLWITTQDDVRKQLSAGYLAGLVMKGIDRFCQSDALAPTGDHIPYIKGIDIPPGRMENNKFVRAHIAPALKTAWADIQDKNGSLTFNHGHYLKMWQLSNPRIGADYILFDEAQDANPVMRAIVAAQTHAQIVYVGDSQQQVYSFTGAVNALAEVDTDHRTFLTQSFRFGPAIAEIANRVLTDLDADLRVKGFEPIKSSVGHIADPTTILCRTNAMAVQTVLTALERGRKPYLVGGAKEVVSFAKAAGDLMAGDRTDHPELACFETWTEVLDYVEQDEQGDDLRLLVRLVTEFGVETILAALDSMATELQADLIVSTAHKAKGREWDSVQLAADFPDQPGEEELRLLYVAVTRAKLRLDIEAVFYLGTLPGSTEVEPVEAPGRLAMLSDEEITALTEEIQAEVMRRRGAHEAPSAPLTPSEDDPAPEAPAAQNGRERPGDGPHTVAEHLEGVEGRYMIHRNLVLTAVCTNSRRAMEKAFEMHCKTSERITVMDEATGELVVEYDA